MSDDRRNRFAEFNAAQERPPLPLPVTVDYYMLRRKQLAEEMRHIEAVLYEAGAISRRLCAPAQSRVR